MRMLIDKPPATLHVERMNPTPESAAETRGLGIALILGSTLVFALSDTAAKLLVATMSPLEASWIRCVVVVVLTVPAVIWRRGMGVFRTAHPVRQTLRALSVWFSSLLFLTGLSYLPLADASAINFIWPILITVFSVLLLGEKVGIRRVTATLIGFLGMLIIIRPGSSAFHIAALFPLGAAVLWALASVMTRGMMTTEAPETTIVWSALVMLVGTTLVLPFYWVMPSWSEIGLGMLVGTGAAVGHAMVIFAYGRANASTLAPFAYVQLVWATACGYLVFGSVPDRWILIGASIIALSGIYTIHRERVRRLAK